MSIVLSGKMVNGNVAPCQSKDCPNDSALMVHTCGGYLRFCRRCAARALAFNDGEFCRELGEKRIYYGWSQWKLAELAAAAVEERNTFLRRLYWARQKREWRARNRSRIAAARRKK